MIDPDLLSHQLRRGDGPYLDHRRRVVLCALVAAGAMTPIALYQMGLIRHLPEPRSRWLDADRIDASGDAYRLLRTPDALLGLTSYGVTAILAGMAGADRHRRHPWLPLALGAKVLIDAAGAGYLTYKQWADFRKFCLYCLIGAGASFAMVPLAWPEVRAALEVLGRR